MSRGIKIYTTTDMICYDWCTLKMVVVGDSYKSGITQIATLHHLKQIVKIIVKKDLYLALVHYSAGLGNLMRRKRETSHPQHREKEVIKYIHFHAEDAY